MPEQEEKLTKKEYYVIGLEERRHNDNLKASNNAELNKIITGVSIGLLFTFLRFQELFSDLNLSLTKWGFLLPAITILFNMVAFYPSQLSFTKNDEATEKTYHKYSRIAHLLENPFATVAKVLEKASHFSFLLSLFFAGYLLFRIFGG